MSQNHIMESPMDFGEVIERIRKIANRVTLDKKDRVALTIAANAIDRAGQFGGITETKPE